MECDFKKELEDELEKFAFKKLLKTEYYHTHYEEYDYSKYE